MIGVAPAGRLGVDRLINFVAARHEATERGGGSQRAAVEEMFLHVVGHFDFEFGAGPHPLKDVLGIALGEPAASGRIARRKWPGSV